jgi:hypothetical protein
VRRIARPREHAALDEPVQPIREHVRRDALLVLQELAEVPPPAEDHVPQDQQRPGIAKNL